MDIVIELLEGALCWREQRYAERASVVVGRCEDADIEVPEDETTGIVVSRHHCLIQIDPPNATVRDLDSLNGTYVNGELIGKRVMGGTWVESRAVELSDGDEIALGRFGSEESPRWRFRARIRIVTEPRCAACGALMPTSADPDAELCSNCAPPIPPTVGPGAGQGLAQEPAAPQGAQPPAPPSEGPDVGDILGQVQAGVRRAAAKASGAGFPSIPDYELISLLGSGAMGEVYRARRISTGAEVAIKIMRPNVAISAQAKQYFLREMEVHRGLDHPHIIRVSDTGSSGGLFFLAMEYCPHGSVADVMRSRGAKFPVREAVDIILDVLDGLDYAHCRAHGRPTGRLVHRDVKPGNVLLMSGADGRLTAFLGDFGLAKAFDTSGASGISHSAGTPGGSLNFMPRQQFLNFKYAKPDVDVWAAGATLRYMLTFEPPRRFSRGADWDTLKVEFSKPVKPVRKVDPSVPEELAFVIDLALRDSPEIVIRDAAHLKRMIEAVM